VNGWVCRQEEPEPWAPGSLPALGELGWTESESLLLLWAPKLLEDSALADLRSASASRARCFSGVHCRASSFKAEELMAAQGGELSPELSPKPEACACDKALEAGDSTLAW
jgi:hypothetical protein